MNHVFDVAILVGSLRKASITRKMAHALVERAPKSLRCKFVEIGDLPLYNEDLEAETPPAWQRFRDEMASVQAVIFLTPEYNRSIPGALKNAIDVGSRPMKSSVWPGKPAGILSVTPGKMGAFGANHALRQALVFLNVPAMQQPEAYIGGAAEMFDEAGKLTNDETSRHLTHYLLAFENWVFKLAGMPQDFESFLDLRKAAADAYSNGDGSPLDALVTTEGPATFFPPTGGMISGAQEVRDRYSRDASVFGSNSKNHLEILQSGASGGVGFWTGFQHFEGAIMGNEVKLKLRITELFRQINGEWKLVHRHADPAGDPK